MKDLDKSLFQIRPTESNPEVEHISKFYTIFGQHDFLENNLPCLIEKEKILDDVKMFAYSIQHGNVITYFCKVDKHGRLYNPIGMNSQNEVRRNKQRSRDNWQFRKQEKKVFDYYLQFLKTKNPAHLNVAQRERI